LEEAAIRECFEETDLKITVEKEVSRYYNNIGDLVFQFEAELQEGQNKNSLTGTWEGEPAWIDLEDLSEYKLGFKLSELITR